MLQDKIRILNLRWPHYHSVEEKDQIKNLLFIMIFILKVPLLAAVLPEPQI